MAGETLLTERIRQQYVGDHRFGISTTVLAELYYAVYASGRRARNMEKLRRMVSALALWPFDTTGAEEFGRIQAEQRAKGRPIPPMDAQIAAVTRQYGLTLLTADQHFQWVDGISLENWLVAD